MIAHTHLDGSEDAEVILCEIPERSRIKFHGVIAYKELVDGKENAYEVELILADLSSCVGAGTKVGKSLAGG